MSRFMNKGTYIVIEGIDGSGKTTQFTRLVDYLGQDVIALHEPGSTAMAEHIRSLVKDVSIPRDANTNSFLFAAARADLIGTIIRPRIREGRTVVSDRNWLTSAAYQTSEGANLDEIVRLNKLAAQEFFEPDLLILIDADPIICRQRLEGRGNHAKDYFDSKGINFFEKARQVYLQEAERLKHAVIINGNFAPHKTWEQVKKAVDILRD